MVGFFVWETYQGSAVAGEDCGVARWAAGGERTVGRGLSAEPEGLACSVKREEVDGRGRAGGHDGEGLWVLWCRVGCREGGAQQREEGGNDGELHVG